MRLLMALLSIVPPGLAVAAAVLNGRNHRRPIDTGRKEGLLRRAINVALLGLVLVAVVWFAVQIIQLMS